MISSVLIGLYNGRMKEVSAAVLDASSLAVTVSLGLIGVMALWLGMMKIAQKAGITDKLAVLISPVLKKLFPDIPKKHPALAHITMNISANMLGLGNAATPMGIRAMEELQKINPNPKDTASDSMCLFLTINTAGVLLIPMSVIAILSTQGAENPSEIILPTFLVTVGSLILGVLFAKLLIRVKPEPSKRKEKWKVTP